MTAPYYQDDAVTIYLGDCRDVMPHLDADVVVTDPPYGDTSLPWDRWPDGWIEALPGTVRQLWSFGSFRMWLDRGFEFTAAGWRYGQEVVWEKHNGSSFHADRFRRVHELAVHWYRGAWSDLPIRPVLVADATARTVRRKGRPAHTGEIGSSVYTSHDGGPQLMRSVIYARSEHGSAEHPTQKPLAVMAPLIAYSAGVVLDPFAGAGSTLRAAKDVGRKAIGIEVDERYAEVAARRCSQEVFAL